MIDFNQVETNMMEANVGDLNTGEDIPKFMDKTREEILDGCIEGLNLFQMVCKPRLLAHESEGEEIITIKPLKKALRCIICYDLMHEPCTVKSCLHKFCSKCIANSGKCPQCRSQIGSRRQLRYDKRID